MLENRGSPESECYVSMHHAFLVNHKTLTMCLKDGWGKTALASSANIIFYSDYCLLLNTGSTNRNCWVSFDEKI